jgi:hypothetical protein
MMEKVDLRHKIIDSRCKTQDVVLIANYFVPITNYSILTTKK